jgi:hypothetical protein
MATPSTSATSPKLPTRTMSSLLPAAGIPSISARRSQCHATAPGKDLSPNSEDVSTLLGTGECQAILADKDPVVSYIMGYSKWRGVRVEYPSPPGCEQYSKTIIDIECDETIRGIFLAEIDDSKPCNTFIRFRTNLACEPKAKSAALFYILFFGFIGGALYVLFISVWYKYTSRSVWQSIVHTECWANLNYKIKECLSGPKATAINLPEQLPSMEIISK